MEVPCPIPFTNNYESSSFPVAPFRSDDGERRQSKSMMLIDRVGTMEIDCRCHFFASPILDQDKCQVRGVLSSSQCKFDILYTSNEALVLRWDNEQRPPPVDDITVDRCAETRSPSSHPSSLPIVTRFHSSFRLSYADACWSWASQIATTPFQPSCRSTFSKDELFSRVSDPCQAFVMQPPEERRSSSHWQGASPSPSMSQPSSSLAVAPPVAGGYHFHHSVADFDAIEETCERWADIISSIAQDAATLRQLSSLLQRLEGGDERSLEMLLDLHAVVTDLETELDEAEEELEASNRAVDELEFMSEEADRHLESLQRVKEAFHLPEEDDEELLLASLTLHDDDGVDGTRSYRDDAHATAASQTFDSESRKSRLGELHYTPSRLAVLNRAAPNGPNPQAMSRGATTPSVQDPVGKKSSNKSGNVFYQARLTEDDLKNIPRTTRGHISLDSINSALEEVLEFAMRKKKRMDRERRAKSQIYTNDRNLQNSRANRGGSDDENGNSSTVQLSAVVLTEQELRQNCAFFRSGEATARSLMLILCAVHRLKQVRGGKNGLVHYHIPEPPRQELSPLLRAPKDQPATVGAVAPSSQHLLKLIHRHRQQQHVTI